MPTKKIKVIIADFDPITIVKGGKFSGFEFEFWQKIAKELKLKCVYSETKFVDIFDKSFTPIVLVTNLSRSFCFAIKAAFS